MRNNWRMKLGAVLLAVLFNAGCWTVLLGVGAAGGIGAYKWIEGTMEKDYPRPMADVWQATLAACKDMNLNIKSEQYGVLESRIEAVAAPDTSVKVQLVARPNNITTAKVRFGLMGNEEASAYFHRRIMAHLGISTQ